MSTSIGSVTSKQPDPVPPPTTSEKPPKEKPPAIDLDAQPVTTGPTNFKEFYANYTKPLVSSSCSAAVADGKSPVESARACTAREFAIMSSVPQAGLTPVETDPACVKEYEKEGAAWGEAAGDEANDRIKDLPAPVVKHRVAKAVKEALAEGGKDVGHLEGVANCKVVVADARAFGERHAVVELPNQCVAPPKPPVEPNFTPLRPSKPQTKAAAK